jgi:hypothetical protein
MGASAARLARRRLRRKREEFMQPRTSRPPKRAWLYAPFVLVALLAVLWSGFWFYSANKAEASVAAWIENEAKAGRNHSCASRTAAGYPFRIEMRCTAPRSEIRTGTDTLTLQARELLALAQVYQPDLIIAELTGPLTVSSPGNADLTAEWRLLQLSVRGLPFAFDRTSLLLEAPRLQAQGAAEPLAQAKNLQAHVRLSPSATRAAPVYEIAASTTDGVIAAVPALAQRPVTAEASGLVRGLHDLSPKPLAQRLRDWQAAGGRLEVTRARVQRGDAVAVSQGQLGLSAEGRIDGTLRVTVGGIEQLADVIFGPNAGRTQAGMLSGLTMLAGRTELEGKRAISVPLRFSNGAVTLGPLRIGQVPPLF